MKKIFIQSKKFITSSALTFNLSMIFIVFYVLAWWKCLWEIGATVELPPFGEIPIFDEFLSMCGEMPVFSLVFLTVLWIGTVKLSVK